jgi:hypothetical protein
MSAPDHLDPRLLRAFTTVAEELHFTRAAARLYVAQQALGSWAPSCSSAPPGR